MITKPAKRDFYAKHCNSNVIALGKSRDAARNRLLSLLWGKSC